MKKKQLYTIEDFKQADPLTKLYIHMMEPERFELSWKQVERLDDLKAVWRIIVKKPNNKDRIRAVVEAFQCDDRIAYRMMGEAAQLFVDTLDVDHDLELRLAYSRMMKIVEKAEAAHDYEAARRALESAQGLLDKIEARTPKQAKQYAQIIVTSDPAALMARNQNVEDAEAEYLELNEPAIPERQAKVILPGTEEV